MSTTVTSKLKNAKISVRKLKLVANLVRGKKAVNAINTLKFTNKKGAKILWPLVYSALKNGANNFNMSEDSSYIKDINVGPGRTIKAGRFSAKGRFNRIVKRSSNIRVVLVQRENTEMVNSSKKGKKLFARGK